MFGLQGESPAFDVVEAAQIIWFVQILGNLKSISKQEKIIMKFLSFAKVFAFAVFLTAATVLNAPAQANSGNNNSGNDNTRAATTRTVERTTTVREDDTDWGWLGLLGLAGLAGLIPKKRAVEVHDNRTVREDRTTGTTTGTTTDTTTNRNTNL